MSSKRLHYYDEKWLDLILSLIHRNSSNNYIAIVFRYKKTPNCKWAFAFLDRRFSKIFIGLL